MKRSNKGGTRPIVVETGIGVVVAIAVTLLLAMGVSLLVSNESAAESNIKYFAIPIQLVAPFLGALIAGKRVDQKYAIVCGSVGASYCFILLAVTILFFDSAFRAVGIGIGMCAAGTVGACAICMMKKGRRGKRK